MRIYDSKTPEGRKVEVPGKTLCPECQGRNGRHVLVDDKQTVQDAQGRSRSKSVRRQCPQDPDVDDADCVV